MEQKGFTVWLRTHEKQLLIAGISVTAVIAIVLGIKNKEAMKELLVMLENRCQKAPNPQKLSVNVIEFIAPATEAATRKYTPCSTCFEVNGHIRFLPDGKHRSAGKTAEAIAAGIKLPTNQTIEYNEVRKSE